MSRKPPPHLPHETPAPATRRGIVITIVGVFVLAGLANLAAIYMVREHPPNLFDHLLTHKWQMLDAREAPADALILGDSSGNQGVDPQILNEQIGGDWLNLCTVGNMLTVGSAWMLNDYIERFGPPEHVLIVNVYDMWYRPAHPSAFARIPRPWGFWWWYEPAVNFDRRQLVEITLTRYAPLYAADVSLRQIIMHPLDTIGNHPEIREDGFMPMKGPWHDVVREDYEAHRRRLRNASFEPSEFNKAGLDRLLHLAEEHGFNVYYAHGPTYDALVAHEKFQDYFAEVNAWLEGIEREHEPFRMVFREPQPFPIEMLQNMEHLTLEGAEIYSNRVAEAIRVYEPHAAPALTLRNDARPGTDNDDVHDQ